MEKKKDLSIESLRGITIFLVVIGHVIGYDSDGGMMVAPDSAYRHFYTLFDYWTMPLFTAISGWVYALRPYQTGTMGSFISKKFNRILLPMFCVGTTYFLLQYLIPGTNRKEELTDIWKILIFPYTYFWYLQALFVVFLVVIALESRKFMQTFKSWLLVFLMTMILFGVRNVTIPEGAPNYFGYQMAIYLLPFFILGIGLNRFKQHLSNNYLILAVGLVFLGCLIIQQLAWYQVIDYTYTRKSGIGPLIGLSMSILLFQVKWNSKWFVWIGSYAYSIYLFHAFGTAAGRIIIKHLGVGLSPVIFISSLLAGMILPILIDKLFDHFALARLLFLGKNYAQNPVRD